MRRIVRDALLFIVAPLAILGGLTAWMLIASAPSCGNSLAQELPSPDGRFKAVVFERSCGASTGFSSNISILAANGILPDSSGNLFVSEGHPAHIGISLRWQTTAQGQQQLQVATKSKVQVTRADASWSVSAEVTAAYLIAGEPLVMPTP